MQVIEFLKEHGIQKLKDDFGIIVKEYPEEGLLVLNYDQLAGNKSYPIVMECRGLILDMEYNVVSRSFSRFFNIGECPETQTNLDFKKASIYQKLDGSLIKCYYYDDKWNISTRGTAFAESNCGDWGITFHDLVLLAMNLSEEEFQNKFNEYTSKEFTYIFEVTSMENRVVTRYEGRNLWLLGIRQNENGAYAEQIYVDYMAYVLEVERPKQYTFNSAEECTEAANALPNLEEGYVIYQGSVPVAKVKSVKYLVCHRIRGDGLTRNRICELVVIGEQDEYISYFPEDEKCFEPYIYAFNHMITEMNLFMERGKNIVDQKEFALMLLGVPFSSVLFSARKKNISPLAEFKERRMNYKVDLLQNYNTEVLLLQAKNSLTPKG